MSKLEADSINFSFGSRTILSDVYLKCARGEIVSIIGRNGSGKSSLMKIIFGSLRAENQSVRINSKYVKKGYQQPGVINYLPQEDLFMNYLTPLRIAKIFDIPEILEIDLIHDKHRCPIGSLSGGLKKFIEIMAMLYAKTQFTLLDEPFSFLSPLLAEHVSEHIRIQSLHKGIILTDHQIDFVWSVANTHYILYGGNLRQIYERNELEQYGYLNKPSTKTTF